MSLESVTDALSSLPDPQRSVPPGTPPTSQSKVDNDNSRLPLGNRFIISQSFTSNFTRTSHTLLIAALRPPLGFTADATETTE